MVAPTRRVRFTTQPPDDTPVTKDELVEILACLEAARASALPLKERDSYLTDYTNRVERMSRRAKSATVRAFTKSLTVRLMELGH
jgi:alkylation response protein AidB-like acyl-CoA dehydrogenase